MTNCPGRIGRGQRRGSAAGRGRCRGPAGRFRRPRAVRHWTHSGGRRRRRLRPLRGGLAADRRSRRREVAHLPAASAARRRLPARPRRLGPLGRPGVFVLRLRVATRSQRPRSYSTSSSSPRLALGSRSSCTGPMAMRFSRITLCSELRQHPADLAVLALGQHDLAARCCRPACLSRLTRFALTWPSLSQTPSSSFCRSSSAAACRRPARGTSCRRRSAGASA